MICSHVKILYNIHLTIATIFYIIRDERQFKYFHKNKKKKSIVAVTFTAELCNAHRYLMIFFTNCIQIGNWKNPAQLYARCTT